MKKCAVAALLCLAVVLAVGFPVAFIWFGASAFFDGDYTETAAWVLCLAYCAQEIYTNYRKAGDR